MEDVGKTKGSSGRETAEAIAYVLGSLLLLVIVYEVGSRFSINDPTVTLYQQMKCCLWRSIVGARMDTLDDRLGDVEREMIRTKQELAIAEGAVLRSFREGASTREAQSALAESVTERDRLAAHLNDLRNIRRTLFLTLKDLGDSRRRTSVEIARLEARLYNP